MDTVEPYNFSWVIPDLLAALGLPQRKEHFDFLQKSGIKTLVSLTERLPSVHQHCPDMKSIHIDIVDFHPPTIEQIETFVNAVEAAENTKQPLAVHCMHGNGRTGTMIACYFVKSKKMTAAEAISQIRKTRPKSLETAGQEQRVAEYEAYLKQCET